MDFSVESRAISSSSHHSDIFVTIAHLPYRLEKDIHSSFANWLGLSESYASNYEDLVQLAESGPKPPGHNGTYRPNYEKVPTWLATPSAFLHQCLFVQMSQQKISMIADERLSQLTVQTVERRNIASHSLEYWLDEVSRSAYLQEHKLTNIKGELLAAYSMILDGLLLNPEQLESSKSYFQETLKNFEIPYSHSPEIGSITLQKLLEGGIRSACLIPLAAGIYGGQSRLLTGDLLTGFEILSSGAGMTICAISTLWVADKIMKGIKTIGQEGAAQPGVYGSRPTSPE